MEMTAPHVLAGEPVIKAALGNDWERLPEILRRNFNLRPGDDCEVRLEGVMYEVRHSRVAKLFVYAGQLLGALVPYQGENIEVRIDIRTHKTDPRFTHWHRVHFFPQNPEYVFSSRMEYLRDNEFIERVKFGVAMRMKASLYEDILKFEAICYQWDLFGLSIRLPNWLLLGTGVIVERQVSAEQFEMSYVIDHPLWGRTFTYRGLFWIVSESPGISNFAHA
jgi:hypothetical protein